MNGMSPPGLIDIGINLAHDSYDADREAVLRRAIEAGVEQFIVTGASVSGTRDAIALALALPQSLHRYRRGPRSPSFY